MSGHTDGGNNNSHFCVSQPCPTPVTLGAVRRILPSSWQKSMILDILGTSNLTKPNKSSIQKQWDTHQAPKKGTHSEKAHTFKGIRRNNSPSAATLRETEYICISILLIPITLMLLITSNI